MQKQSFHSHLLLSLLFILINCYTPPNLMAQDKTVSRSPEEQRELFGYCEKPRLMKQLSLAEETADKIGDINYWVTLQKLKIKANTNDTFATPNEVKEVVIKKYKNLRLSGDQLKVLVDKYEAGNNEEPCAVITLTVNHQYDTLAKPQMLQLFKTRYRKQLIDKAGINGRQADNVFEVEVWKQKEALDIDAIPIADFNRVRKTVAMYRERERRFKVIGLTEQQTETAIEFLNQHVLEIKK